jgi:hypothetical protein
VNEAPWRRRQAAEYLGLNVGTFDQYVKLGKIPAATATRGKLRVWDADVIRACRRQRDNAPAASRPIARTVTGAPDAEASLWTGRQCADHHGISSRAWRDAVALGEAPAPVGHQGKNTPVWDAAAVRGWCES